MTFGEWIRQTRKSQPVKMSQEDLGQAVGLSKGYISQIETDSSSSTGLPPRVSDDHLRSLAKALGVEEHEMFSRATKVVPKGFTIVPQEGKAHNSGSLFISELLATYPDGDKVPVSEVAQIKDELEAYVYARVGRRLQRKQPAQIQEQKTTA